MEADGSLDGEAEVARVSSIRDVDRMRTVGVHVKLGKLDGGHWDNGPQRHSEYPVDRQYSPTYLH
jgi:hypothetical protein